MDARLAALAAHDIPPHDEGWGGPDPDCGRPAELAGLDAADLAALIAAAPPPVAEASGAGFLPRDGSGGGCGFADGGDLDVLAPGVALAGFADDAHARLGGLDDDALIGVLRAWRRQTSWAQARELAAVAELARRRPADRTPAAAPGQFPRQLSEFIADEIAAALTLACRTAGYELDLALDLAQRLAGTAAALAAGQIDLTKARAIAAGTAGLTAAHAAAVEAAVLPDAPATTAGQLRGAVDHAAMAHDPQALRRRRDAAEKNARVEYWRDPEGTATLAGRYLPPAAAMAADKRVCGIAAAWKTHGAIGGADLLRARAYLALLLGHDTTVPPADLLPAGPPAPGSRPGHPAGPQAPAGLRRPSRAAGLPPLAGSVCLTLPLRTLLGWADAPGDAAGYGPLHGDIARDLANAAAAHPATQWHLIITDPDGHALGYAHTPRRRPAPHTPGGWTITLTTEPLARERSP
jgi:hypothetical protein